MNRHLRKKNVPRILVRIVLFSLLGALVLFAVLNAVVCLSSAPRMRSLEDSLGEKGYDCILVLGCGVWGETPTPLLSDRLDAAIALYQAGVAPKLLMSGDHGREDYNEVAVMRQYALDEGVPSEDIFLDHAGFSTYETMVRAKKVFGVEKAVVVTQKYHLYRALYDAAAFGIEAKGTVATGHVFASQLVWDLRESVARVKDGLWCLFRPAPTYLGDRIDIHGNGEATLD